MSTTSGDCTRCRVCRICFQPTPRYPVSCRSLESGTVTCRQRFVLAFAPRKNPQVLMFLHPAATSRINAIMPQLDQNNIKAPAFASASIVTVVFFLFFFLCSLFICKTTRLQSGSAYFRGLERRHIEL